jgi:hypothetical protein
VSGGRQWNGGLHGRSLRVHVQASVPRVRQRLRSRRRSDGVRSRVHALPRSGKRSRHVHRRYVWRHLQSRIPSLRRQMRCGRSGGVWRGLHGVPRPRERNGDMHGRRVRDDVQSGLRGLRRQRCERL